jgi:hypothetical protein
VDKDQAHDRYSIGEHPEDNNTSLTNSINDVAGWNCADKPGSSTE